MIDKLKEWLADYEVKVITRCNFEEVFGVYDTNQDFFLLTQGSVATIESSAGDVDALPPDCDAGQKLYVGIWQNSRAVAVLDVIERYPEQTSFWIGLIIVHGDLQGARLGSAVVDAVIGAAKTVGYETARLGVVQNNLKGIAFWQRHGFETTRTSGDIVVMQKLI